MTPKNEQWKHGIGGLAMISDSGNRTEFETGAVRDIQEGKGRCDLLPLDIVNAITRRKILELLAEFQRTLEKENLYKALEEFIENCFAKEEDALLELSIHFEEGAIKYGEYNWQKGIPYSRYIDSAVRHYLKFLRNDTDERHDRAFMWNIVCLIWTVENKPEMNDLVKRKKDEELCLNG